MTRNLSLTITLLVLLLVALPAAADSDDRLNPSGAEYYTIYCRDDLVFAYRADGQYMLRTPIAYLLGLDAGGDTWETNGVTVARAGDTITVSGYNGNNAPEYGEKSFSLAQCVSRNGYTPAAETPPVPRAASSAPIANPCLYTVKEGDTAYYIADRYATTPQLLALYNRIENVSQIYVGQEISIPGCSGVASGVTLQEGGYSYSNTSASRGSTHTVKAGEMLQWIADRYGVSVEALVTANGITNPNLIWEGAVLTIP